MLSALRLTRRDVGSVSSVNQLIATSLAEKMAALMTGEYLEARAKKGSRRKFDRVLKKVKSREPVEGDKV